MHHTYQRFVSVVKHSHAITCCFYCFPKHHNLRTITANLSSNALLTLLPGSCTVRIPRMIFFPFFSSNHNCKSLIKCYINITPRVLYCTHPSHEMLCSLNHVRHYWICCSAPVYRPPHVGECSVPRTTLGTIGSVALPLCTGLLMSVNSLFLEPR